MGNWRLTKGCWLDVGVDIIRVTPDSIAPHHTQRYSASNCHRNIIMPLCDNYTQSRNRRPQNQKERTLFTCLTHPRLFSPVTFRQSHANANIIYWHAFLSVSWLAVFPSFRIRAAASRICVRIACAERRAADKRLRLDLLLHARTDVFIVQQTHLSDQL